MNFRAKTIDHDCNNCARPRSEHSMLGACPGTKTFTVDIKEVHDVTVTVSLPKGATREEICDAAEEAHGNAETLNTKYNRTIPKDEWTIREGDEYI